MPHNYNLHKKFVLSPSYKKLVEKCSEPRNLLVLFSHYQYILEVTCMALVRNKDGSYNISTYIKPDHLHPKSDMKTAVFGPLYHTVELV